MSTSKTYQQSLADAGSETRPPMLERGPYQFEMFIPNNSTVPKLQTAEDLQGDALLHYDAEMELMNLILLSIPNDIYNSMDACTSAKDMWKRVERLMRGTIQNKVERENRFTNEFDKFVAEPGEALVSIYNRFAQLMNDLERNDMHFPIVTINTKFLNSLQPEWLKYVTQVRLVKHLTVDTFDDLFYYLQQFEKLVNVSRAKKLEKSHDPLALVAHTGSSSRNTSSYYAIHPTSVVDYEDEYQQDDVHTNFEDPLTSAMLLLARAITQNFSTLTNNRLHTSSNTRNQAIIQEELKDKAHTGSSSRNTSSYYVTHPTSVVDCEDEYQQDDVHTNSEDPLTSAMLNQAIIQGDRVKIQSRNSGNAERNIRQAYVQEEIETLQLFNATTAVEKDIMLGIVQSQEMEEIEELSANICLMARIQPANNTSDAGPSYDSAFISEVQSSSNTENEEQIGSIEKDTHVPDLCALEQLARNAYQEAEKQQIFAQKVQKQNTTLTSQLELYKERVRVLENINGDNNYLNEFLEADKRAKHFSQQAQSQFVRDRDIIRDLEKQRDKLDLDVKDYKRKNEELQKTHSILKRQMSENEDKYHDTVLDLEAKLKKNVDLILKLGNSLQGMFMLGPKPLSVYDQQLKHGLGYPNPYTLKQAISQCPKLYLASSLGNSEISLNVRDTEDTLDDASKSQQKVYEKMNDPIAVANKQNCWTIDYAQINALYKDFVPQKELSAEQKYFPSSFIPSDKNSNATPSIPASMPKSELCELEKQNDFLKDQLLEVSLKHRVELSVLLNHECVDNSLHAKIEKLKKKSIEIQEVLQARIKILEKDVQRCEKQSVDFELKLQHEKEKHKWDSSFKNKNTNPLDYSWISKMEKLKDENVSLDFTVQSLIKERDNVKLEYQKLFNSIKKTRSQTQTEMDELIAHVSEKTYAYSAIRVENQNLLFTISELKTRLKNVEKGKSVNTKFDKTNGFQPRLCVTPLHKHVVQKKMDVQKSKENHVVSKPITLPTSPAKQSGVNSNKNVIAPGMYKVVTTHESQTNETKHDLSSTGLNAASSKVAVYVRKNKETDITSENVISNKENVIDVDVANASKAKTLLCVSCMQNVLIPCHDNCFANYKLNVHSNVSRTLSAKSRTPKSYDTTYVVHKTRFSKESTLSKSLDTTYVVSKPKIDVGSTSKANDKVSSTKKRNLRDKSLSTYMKNKIQTSRIWQKWFESKPNVVWSPVNTKPNGQNSCSSEKQFVSVKKWVVKLPTCPCDVSSCVAGLGHNLFSVGQFCDGDLEVAFRSKTCYVRNLEGDDLLTSGRESNLYTISISDMAASSPVCLMSKATSTKSWLWHHRLSHLNFGTINDLTRLDLVDGLPKFKYGKDHLCSACERGKSKKASHPLKLVPSDHSKLELLHMDLCGPMRVASINGKKYILVIVDDYSRYTWVYFLHSKDETPEIIKKFIAQAQLNYKAKVCKIRTDNGTEFKNATLKAHYEKLGIMQQFSTARTPQQNGVVERRNRTLVEAALIIMAQQQHAADVHPDELYPPNKQYDLMDANQKPVAPPSSDYIPGQDLQTPPVPQDEDEREPMFVQAHDPDYVPEPIYPEYIPLEDEHEFPAEEQPLPPVDSPTAESPGYVTESDPEEDPEEYEDDRQIMSADYLLDWEMMEMMITAIHLGNDSMTR
ncbi:retrovirus-related pol polyprotein from transposon TNT 1-94 [Tanacetum coccineum]